MPCPYQTMSRQQFANVSDHLVVAIREAFVAAAFQAGAFGLVVDFARPPSAQLSWKRFRPDASYQEGR